MYQSLSLPLYKAAFEDYEGWDNLRQDCTSLGLDGVEGIWAGEDIPNDFPLDMLVGYHLTFYADWLDFYREDKSALSKKFGSLETAYAFYGGKGPETLLKNYRADLERARAMKAKYVVFHVSDVSMEETYSYDWLHSDKEVMEASAEIINSLLRDIPADFEFLVENQWWPGFTFTRPEKTEALLDSISFERKGIMLDTGHLMNTNTAIRTQAEGLQHIHSILKRHGELCGMIRGMHLHQSVSGSYVRKSICAPSDDLPESYIERFGKVYAHVQKIDRHRPWRNPEVSKLIDEVQPSYLTHELYAADRKSRRQAVCSQLKTLKKGWQLRE